MTEAEHTGREDTQSGYEVSDVNVRRILVVVAIIGIFLVVALLFLNSFFISERNQIEYEEVLKPTSKKLQQLHQRENETLNTYAVVDTAQGIYQIPIDRAMQLQAQEEFQRRVQQRGTH